MKRIKELNLYPKGILAVMAIMALVFASVYSKTISRVGFEYMDTILVPAQENGGTVYSGKIRGQQAQFTVTRPWYSGTAITVTALIPPKRTLPPFPRTAKWSAA